MARVLFSFHYAATAGERFRKRAFYPPLLAPPSQIREKSFPIFSFSVKESSRRDIAAVHLRTQRKGCLCGRAFRRWKEGGKREEMCAILPYTEISGLMPFSH